MRNKVELVSLITVMLIAGFSLLSVSGCSVFRATGRGVEAVGDGAGTAISGTGRAIADGADDTQDDLRRRRR